MSIIVEDGTGKADSETYISVADASTYHTARGNSAWAALATDAIREQCLRKATDYMIQAYRSRWKGTRGSATQALDWPRSEVYLEPVAAVSPSIYYEYSNLVASNIVPEPVKRACAELALKAATAELLADQNQAVLSEQVGPIAVTYDKNSPQRVRYAAVDSLLSPYFRAGGGCSVGLVRT